MSLSTPIQTLLHQYAAGDVAVCTIVEQLRPHIDRVCRDYVDFYKECVRQHCLRHHRWKGDSEFMAAVYDRTNALVRAVWNVHNSMSLESILTILTHYTHERVEVQDAASQLTDVLGSLEHYVALEPLITHECVRARCEYILDRGLSVPQLNRDAGKHWAELQNAIYKIYEVEDKSAAAWTLEARQFRIDYEALKAATQRIEADIAALRAEMVALRAALNAKHDTPREALSLEGPSTHNCNT